MSPPLAADVQLVERIAAGDHDAHEQFYERHRLSVYAQVYALLVDAASADKVVEETFERVWHAAKQFNPGDGSAFTWLSGIARSLARRQRRPPQHPESSRVSA